METSEHLESLEQAKTLQGSSFGIAAKTVSNNSVSKCSTLVMFQKVFAHVGRSTVCALYYILCFSWCLIILIKLSLSLIQMMGFKQ